VSPSNSPQPFVEKLAASSEANGSLLCIGLDPEPASMPPNMDVATFNRAIVEATSDLVCAYKPNLAFYEALGMAGFQALRATINCIPEHVPVIGDAKRGDVGHTARAYAKAMFEVWGFDAVTVHPYIGRDSIEPFAAYEDRGVLVICRTSNPGESDFQRLPVAGEGGSLPLYERVALAVREWNTAGNLGLVVGATHPDELARVRELCPELPILIPGIGAQGGDLAASVRNGTDHHGRKAIISSSRQVLYASAGSDFAAAARQVALALRESMREALAARSSGATP